MVQRQITIIPNVNPKSDVCTVVICDLVGGRNKIDFVCLLASVGDIVRYNLQK